jgi:hypothetical protein
MMDAFWNFMGTNPIGWAIMAGVIFGITQLLQRDKTNPHGKTFSPEQCTDPVCLATRRGILTGGHPETNQAILSASKSMAADVTQGINRNAPIVRSTETGTTDQLENKFTADHFVYAPGAAEMGFVNNSAASGVSLFNPASSSSQGNAVGLQQQQLQDYNPEVFDMGNGASVLLNAKSIGGK